MKRLAITKALGLGLAGLCVASISAPLWAADVKISALPSASALGGTEQLPGVQSGSTVKITPAQIATYAQGQANLATNSTVARTDADRFGQSLNVKDFGAKGDAVAHSDGVITSGTSAFASTASTFVAADVGKTIQIDGAAGVGSAPLVTTIASFVDGHDVTLSDNATASTGRLYLSGVTPVTAEASGSYIPGETLSLSGGTSSSAASAKVLTTKIVSATINAAGSGSANGSCVLTGTTGAGTPFKINATISGGAVTALGSIVNNGHYTTNPTSLSAEPVTGSCGAGFSALTGATLTLVMGVDTASVNAGGNYSAVPSNPISTGAGSSSGATGATLTASWITTGSFVYGTDDTTAFTAAMNKASTLWSSGQRLLVYAPAGDYLINGSPLPLFSGVPGGIVGDGHNKTVFTIGASYSGDLFSWSEAWLAASIPFNGPGLRGMTNAGPIAKGFTVTADRLASGQQNALAFYDRNDFAYIDDVDVLYLNGRAFYTGAVKNTTQGYMRESRIGRVRAFNAGAAGVPVMEFTSQGSGDGSNEINVAEIDIYAPYGPGLVLRNAATASSLRDIKFDKLRIEGLESNAANIAADLLQIGDGTLTGIVNNIFVANAELIDPYNGYCAIHLNAPSGAAQPYNIVIDSTTDAKSSVGGGLPLGCGVRVDAGRNSAFHIPSMFSWGANVIVGPSTTVGGALLFDGNGNEQSWSYSVDSTAYYALQMPVWRYGNPAINTTSFAPFFSVQTADGTPAGGVARGAGAFDGQALRDQASQVASGSGSSVLGGRSNTASGQYSSILGGWGNTASGTYSMAFGTASVANQQGGIALGISANANRIGCMVYGYGSLLGNAQAAECILRAIAVTGTSAARLTADGAAAGAANVMNLGTNYAQAIDVRAVCIDKTTVGTTYLASLTGALFAKGATNSATTLTGPSIVTQSTGTVTGASISMTADTSLGGINVSFTPPTANTDTWDCMAAVRTGETL